MKPRSSAFTLAFLLLEIFCSNAFHLSDKSSSSGNGSQITSQKPSPRNNYSCTRRHTLSQPGQTAVIQSPNYDREYPNNVYSTDCYTSPTGTTMSIKCDDFNMEPHYRCYYDYLGLRLDESSSSIKRFCGRTNTLSSPQTSKQNSLAVVFHSDFSNPGSTTSSPFRFRCTVTVSERSTASSPPGKCNCGQRNGGTRIVGGTETRPHEFPWRCYLKTSRYSSFCGCAIISNRWILTAAHCTASVMPLRQGDVLSVVVGAHNKRQANSNTQQIPVEKVFDHPAYNKRTVDNDISLLKLSRPLIFNNAVSSVCLPFNYANDEFNGTTVTASGWGTTRERGTSSDILQKVDLPVLTTAQCSKYYPGSGQITSGMICTYLPGKDTCQGDSGGSIDLHRNGRYYHIGVVSWGYGCARERRPGVYAKTTKFLDFIKSTTGEEFCRD